MCILFYAVDIVDGDRKCNALASDENCDLLRKAVPNDFENPYAVCNLSSENADDGDAAYTTDNDSNER